MGFSLEVFFDELRELLAADMKPEKKLLMLDELVVSMRKYAAECGKIDRP